MSSSDETSMSIQQPQTPLRRLPVMTVLALALAGLAVLSLGMGQISIPPGTVLRVIAAQIWDVQADWPASVEQIVTNVRLPRILAAVIVGAALAAAGAAYQTLFRNPIVAPDVLGVSAGAGFGASLAVMFNLGALAIQGAAFAFGLCAVALVFVIGQAINRHSLIVLVLVGVVIAAFFQAMISVLKIVADPVNVLPVITFWLLGGLNKVTSGDLPLVTALIGSSLAVLLALRWQINVMAVGADEARMLGIDVRVTRLALILAATLMTASAVSIAGIVGWVGLVVPHIARLLVGSSFDRLLPASALTGALFLLLVDNLSRAATAMEIPLGITTSVIGAPLFLVLLLRSGKVWS
ncbi:MAG: FecCD family ABC transporter permease [Pseudorhodobacter sp.]